jgi:uncharacterized membrane protein
MLRQALILLALASPLAAHDVAEHAAKAAHEAQAAAAAGAESAQTAVVQAGDKVAAAAGQAADAAKASVAKAGDAANAAVKEAVVVLEPLDVLKEHAGKHLHNKLVHFPVALGLFGSLFLLLSYRYPSYKWPARILLFSAGVFALFALPTGAAQATEFEGTSLTKVLQWHALAGKASLGLIWGAFLLSFFEASRKFFWFYALLLAGAILLAGGLGGILASA